MSKLLLHFCILRWCADWGGIGGLPQSRDSGQITGKMRVAEGVAAERLLNSSKMSFVILIMLFV
jgi:hypothetical protein